MSERPIHPKIFEESLPAWHRIFIEDFRTFKIKRIVWDLDETLGDTQAVVKEEFDLIAGTNYKDRILDRFDGLSHWAHEDGVMTFEEAHELESRLWTSEDILGWVKPFHGIQVYSRDADKNDVEQFVVTSRTGRLDKVTFAWSLIHYPWIPRENVRITTNRDVRYDFEFKVSETGLIEPEAVVDDNNDHILMMLKNAPSKTRFVWLARLRDTSVADDKRVLAVPGGARQFSRLVSHNLDTLA